MNLNQSIAAVAEELEVDKKEARRILDGIANVATTAVKGMDVFVLPGLGRLTARKRDARIGRNPATGEKIKIAAKKVVKFTVAKDLKQLLAPPKKK